MSRQKTKTDDMLIVQDQIWNRVTINRAEKKSTRYYMDEFHLLLKEEQTAAYSVEIRCSGAFLQLHRSWQESHSGCHLRNHLLLGIRKSLLSLT